MDPRNDSPAVDRDHNILRTAISTQHDSVYDGFVVSGIEVGHAVGTI